MYGQTCTHYIQSEVFKVLALDKGSRASSSFHSPAGSDDDADEPGICFFRTFLRLKKSAKLKSAKVTRTRVRECFGASAQLSAHQMPRAGAAAHSRPCDERTMPMGHAWVRLDTLSGSYWRNLDLQHSNGTRPGRGSCGGAQDSVHRRMVGRCCATTAVVARWGAVH